MNGALHVTIKAENTHYAKGIVQSSKASIEPSLLHLYPQHGMKYKP